MILYRQGKDNSCLFSGLASALAFFGDKELATSIYKVKSPKYYNYETEWKLAYSCMRNYKWVPVRYEQKLSDNVKKEYPFIEECILLVVLYASDGSVNHSVSICQGYIFDSNCSHAMRLTKESLDWSCSAPGFPAEFIRFHKALYFVPPYIQKEYRLSCNMERYEKLLSEHHDSIM